MDVLLDRSPKCHPEMAGEGINYARGGMGKNKYRGLPLSAKRSKETFRKGVKGCIISRDYIDLAACRKFSRVELGNTWLLTRQSLTVPLWET